MSQAIISYIAKFLEVRTGGVDTYVKQIDKVHHEVHDGNCFTANYLELSVANDGYTRLNLSTGAKQAHLSIQIVTEGKAYYKTFLGTTFTGGTGADASKLTIFNRNNTSSTTPVTTAKYGITVVSAGTMRGNQLINGGTGGNATGSSSGNRIETIIAPNSSFTVEVQNKKGQAQDIEIVLDWYEE